MLHNFQRVFIWQRNSIRIVCPGKMISHKPVMRRLIFLLARTRCWITNQDPGFETLQIMWHHSSHDDVIECKHLSRYWTFLREIHRSSVNSPRKGQWRGALMFSLICGWTNGWANHQDAADLIHHRANYDVTVVMADSWNSALLTTYIFFHRNPSLLIIQIYMLIPYNAKSSTATPVSTKLSMFSLRLISFRFCSRKPN